MENLAISLRDLIPNTLDVRVQNDFHVDFKRLKSESSHCHRIKIKVKGMGLRIHKVAFAVELLKGVHFKDKGILDLLIRDVGLSIVVDVPKTYSEHFFTVHKVKVRVRAIATPRLHAVLTPSLSLSRTSRARASSGSCKSPCASRTTPSFTS